MTDSEQSDSTVPASTVFGEEWELPEGFEWEYQDDEDGGGSQYAGSDGVLHGEIILPTRRRRAVGPWEIVRERKVYRS